MRRLSLYVLAALLAFPCVVKAQPGVIIESPQPGETVSGVYVIRFIDCNGTIDSFSFDDSPNTLQFATEISRGDATTFCNGNTNVGGASLFNWGLVPPGEHTVHFRDAENNIVTSQTINVVNFGEEYKTTFNPVAMIMQNQPMDGMTTEMRPSVSAQGYQVVAVRTADDPDPTGDELNDWFLNKDFTLNFTNPDGSVETHNYLFTRVITYTNGVRGIVADTPNTNSAVLATSMRGPFGDDILWIPPHPINMLDFDNCLSAFLAPPTVGITLTLATGSLVRGQRNDAGQCAAFPFVNVIDAKPMQGTIGPAVVITSTVTTGSLP